MGNVVIMVGIDDWEEWTLPAIRSIQIYDPILPIFVIDNASDKAYPHRFQDWDHPIPTVLRLHDRVCYAAAINHGFSHTDADWTIVLNNDITATGSIREALAWMTPDALWGNQLITHGQLRWLGLWLFAIPRVVREKVGLFDEHFEVCGFDDADYCFRAAQAGFRIEKSMFPIFHHWGKTRWKVPNYAEIRERNRLYLEAKHNLSIGQETDWEVFN